MGVNSETISIFPKYKCGLISMSPEEHVYDSPTGDGDLLFFNPTKDKLTLHKVTGRDTSCNMPIVDMTNNEGEWKIQNNEDLTTILDLLYNHQ